MIHLTSTEGVDMIPFFVVNRSMNLRLLKGLPLQEYTTAHIGIMIHANTTRSFQRAFLHYPCDELDYCDAIGGACQHKSNISYCPEREYILSHTIKMCDSGIFTRDGPKLTYDELFEAYSCMGVEYGIMIDVFRDGQATVESAHKALQTYETFKDSFKLVGVAQGDSFEEYLDCYIKLKNMGFDHVAVGGLLRRRKNTVRYPYLRSGDFMFRILEELRQRYPNDWLFALGCFHPNRLPRLKELNVWADYKGWVFRYDKRNVTLENYLKIFSSNHLQHLGSDGVSDQISTLKYLLARRNRAIAQLKKLSQKLFDGRRTLRANLSSLHYELAKGGFEIAGRFRNIITHGLLKDTEKNLVAQALQKLGKKGSEEANLVLRNIQRNRELKEQLWSVECRIEQANILLADQLTRLTTEEVKLPQRTKQLCTMIACLIEKTEREYRFEQVQRKIAEEILALL